MCSLPGAGCGDGVLLQQRSEEAGRDRRSCTRHRAGAAGQRRKKERAGDGSGPGTHPGVAEGREGRGNSVLKSCSGDPGGPAASSWKALGRCKLWFLPRRLGSRPQGVDWKSPRTEYAGPGASRARDRDPTKKFGNRHSPHAAVLSLGDPILRCGLSPGLCRLGRAPRPLGVLQPLPPVDRGGCWPRG